MPRRFYCRARWHTAGVEGETQVFDIDFPDREGRRLGGINEFTVKRAPREALMRGLGGDATRLLYTLGWHEAPTPGSADADSTQGTWLIAGFDELAAAVPGSVTLDPCAGAENWEQAFASAAEDGNPVAGIVWRSAGRAGDEVSTSDLAERLDTEIAGLLAAAQTALAAEKPNLTGGLWIVTERAVATEPGEPVDPVNAALWGAGRTIIAEQPTLRCRLLDLDTSDSAGWLAGHSELRLPSPKWPCAREVPGFPAAALGTQRPSAHAAQRGLRAGPDRARRHRQSPPGGEGGLLARFQRDSGSGGGRGPEFPRHPQRSGSVSGDPGPIGGDLWHRDRNRLGRHRFEVGQRVSARCRARSPAG